MTRPLPEHRLARIAASGPAGSVDVTCSCGATIVAADRVRVGLEHARHVLSVRSDEVDA